MKLPESILGRTLSTPYGHVTSEQVQAVFEAVANGLERSSAIAGARGNSDRRVDRATQVLREAGFIEFVSKKHGGNGWRVNERVRNEVA